jgi:hypothetical protein
MIATVALFTKGPVLECMCVCVVRAAVMRQRVQVGFLWAGAQLELVEVVGGIRRGA